MESFIDRLKQEKIDLDQKREKLEAFLNDTERKEIVDGRQISLLNIQKFAMDAYSQCLTERLALL